MTAYSNLVGMFNRYKYAANNPYRFTDPDGRREKVTGSNIAGNSNARSFLSGATAYSGSTVPSAPKTTVQQFNASASQSGSSEDSGRNWLTGQGSLTDFEAFTDDVLPPLLSSPEGALAGGGAKFVGAGMLAVRLGWAGENAVRAAYNIGGRGFFFVNGRLRISDGLNRGLGTLSEIKNVQSLSYTRQLRDYTDFARSQGLQFNLYVRPGAQLSNPLLRAEAAGHLKILDIPTP